MRCYSEIPHSRKSFTIEIWISYQYTYLVPSYIEDLLCTYNHNYPKCSYNCSHHTDKHFFPCIHQHLNEIKRNYTKSYIFTKTDHIMKKPKLKLSRKKILPSHLLLPSPSNPTGQWQPFTLDSYIQKGKSVSLESCTRMEYNKYFTINGAFSPCNMRVRPPKTKLGFWSS